MDLRCLSIVLSVSLAPAACAEDDGLTFGSEAKQEQRGLQYLICNQADSRLACESEAVVKGWKVVYAQSKDDSEIVGILEGADSVAHYVFHYPCKSDSQPPGITLSLHAVPHIVAGARDWSQELDTGMRIHSRGLTIAEVDNNSCDLVEKQQRCVWGESYAIYGHELSQFGCQFNLTVQATSKHTLRSKRGSYRVSFALHNGESEYRCLDQLHGTCMSDTEATLEPEAR